MTVDEVIAGARDRILQRWTSEVRRMASEAKNLDPPELVDHIPGVLDEIIRALHRRAGISEGNPQAVEHGKQRLRIGFDLATVVREYAVLRSSILDVLEEAGVSPTLDEFRSLANSINAGIADAVVEYTESRTKVIELFLGVLTHDLRDPLNAISTGAQLIMRHQSELPAVVIRVCGRISGSAERMAGLLNELMDFSRAGLGGGLRLRRRWTDLCEVLSTVVDELEISYPDRTFQLDVEGSCTGTWDADRLVQVISNLGTNAVRYGTKESPISFRLRSGGDEAIIEVHNFGNVIPTGTAATLFDPFVTDPQHGGTGLGLYIVREIVRAHDGTIDVESSEKAGTIFRIHLPRRVT